MSAVFEPLEGSSEEAFGRPVANLSNDSLSSTDTLSEEEMADLPRREQITRDCADDSANYEGRFDTAALEAGTAGDFYNSHSGTAAEKRRLAREQRLSVGKSSPSEVQLDQFLELTRSLQAEEDRREQAQRIAAAAREREERQVRNRRWAEVKARLTARNSSTTAASLRSAEWDDSGEDWPEDAWTFSGGAADRLSARGNERGAAVPMADDPLIDPASGEERPMRRLVKREKLPWTVEFWHTAYNWFRWAVLGLFYMRDLAEDPSGYYQKRKFD